SWNQIPLDIPQFPKQQIPPSDEIKEKEFFDKFKALGRNRPGRAPPQGLGIPGHFCSIWVGNLKKNDDLLQRLTLISFAKPPRAPAATAPGQRIRGSQSLFSRSLHSATDRARCIATFGRFRPGWPAGSLPRLRSQSHDGLELSIRGSTRADSLADW